MRTRLLLGLTAVLILLTATCAIARDDGALKFDSYGLSLSIPVPYDRMSMQLPPVNGLVEAYKSNNLVYVVIATDDIQPKNATARQALNLLSTMIGQAAAKMPALGLHAISGNSAQSKAAVGFGGKVDPNQVGTAKTAMDYATQIPPELRQMYGSDIYQAVLMAPFTETGRMIVGVAVVGPGSRQQEIDSAAAQVMSTVTIGASAAAANAPKESCEAGEVAPAPVAVQPINQIEKGQIELIGTVKSIDKKSKSLGMMVSQVTSYGQLPVILNPARQKKVFVKSIPADVKKGTNVVVLAVDSGVGKPVKAVSIKAMEPNK